VLIWFYSKNNPWLFDEKKFTKETESTSPDRIKGSHASETPWIRRCPVFEHVKALLVDDSNAKWQVPV
jgi:hypothetical protein